MADTDVLAVVWGETSSIAPKDGSNAALAISATLVLGFFSILVAMTTIGAAELIGAKGSVFTSSPELGETFTALLVASRATYLSTKAHVPRRLNQTSPDRPD